MIDSSKKVEKSKISAIAIVAVLVGAAFTSTIGMTVQMAFAVGGTLDQTLCENSMGGTWAVDTCTTAGPVTIGSGETLTIPSGVILVINNIAGSGISNSGSIDNLGTIEVENTGGTGINNVGTGIITNSGTMTVSNTGGTSEGLHNHDGASAENSGTLTVTNTGGTGINNDNVGTIDNSGTMTVSNTDGKGINNDDSTITNSGTLTFANTDGDGLVNGGTFTNSGTIFVNSSGEDEDGIVNSGGSNPVFENTASGNITVANSGDLNRGIHIFDGSLTNAGTITLSNTDGSIAILVNALMSNSGTLIVTDSGGFQALGINEVFENDGTVENSGLISNRFSGTFDNDGEINNLVGGLLDNFGELNNGDFGTIENFGVLKNEVFSGHNANLTNDGQINNNAGAEIDNLGSIDNTLGGIFNECGATYFGNAPTGNAVVNEICDTIDPETTITGAFDGKGVKFNVPKKGVPTTSSTGAKFFFSGTDNIGVQKFQCSLDGATFTDCTSPITYTNLQNAITHTFRVRAVDAAGNVDDSPATFTWKINPPKLK